MDKKELAHIINGREYDYGIFKDVRRAAIDAGLVIISGASDDLIEQFMMRAAVLMVEKYFLTGRCISRRFRACKLH